MLLWPLKTTGSRPQSAPTSLLFTTLSSGKRTLVMIDQDFLSLAVILFAVLALLLTPPGPGTPLRQRVPNR
jgi:hypothetical protein